MTASKAPRHHQCPGCFFPISRKPSGKNEDYHLQEKGPRELIRQSETNLMRAVFNGIIEMDRVVQENTANADASAATSDAMQAQAEKLKAHVNELLSMVAGRKSSRQPWTKRLLSTSGKAGLPGVIS